jgi:hypothetical protein
LGNLAYLSVKDRKMITPEHLHLALNHLPFLGAGFALLPLLMGLFWRQRLTVMAGLILAVVTGWMTPLVMVTGEEAYERYEDGPVAQFLDPQAESFLEVHEHRAEAWSKLLYLSAVVPTLGLGVVIWKPTYLRGVAGVSALFCAAALFAGIWIAESGGSIRRPDFRPGAGYLWNSSESPELLPKGQRDAPFEHVPISAGHFLPEHLVESVHGAGRRKCPGIFRRQARLRLCKKTGSALTLSGKKFGGLRRGGVAEKVRSRKPGGLQFVGGKVATSAQGILAHIAQNIG